ncbi:MAG: FkbM family methyltransferase [Candidatus Hodarchaeota archaeon]
MYLDPCDSVISKSLFLYKTWEPFVSYLFCQNISKGDIVVDIGAHIGWYSLLASLIVGKQGIIYAFEPEPRTFTILLLNIKLNDIKNIIPINKALSDSSGYESLFLNLYNEYPSIYQMWPTSDGESILVETVTFNEYFKNKHIDVIKIDAEGYEVKIFRGAEQILSRNPKLIIFSEFWPEGLRGAGTSPEEYIDLVSKHGFNIQIIKNGRLKRISNKEVLNLDKSSNFLLTHSCTHT